MEEAINGEHACEELPHTSHLALPMLTILALPMLILLALITALWCPLILGQCALEGAASATS